jgi:hypothetical protein
MRISSAGNVGIGVAPTDPSGFGRIFQLHGASSSIMRFTGSTYGVGANDGPFIGMSYGGLEISNPRSTGYIHLSTAGVVAAKIDSSGRVLMGTATESNAHANADDLIIGNVPASGEKRGITIVTGNDTSGAIHFSDGTATGNANIQGQLVYEHSDNSFRFYTAAAQRVRIDADGLKFGTDTAAANALDDYEEGTFNSHIYDDHDDSLKISFTAQGDYVKIGNVLTFNAQCFANGVASTTFTGKPYMRLPFTIAQANATIAYIGYYNGIGTAKQGYVLGAGVNEIRFATQLDNPYNNQLADGDTWGGNVRLYISGTVAVAI